MKSISHLEKMLSILTEIQNQKFYRNLTVLFNEADCLKDIANEAVTTGVSLMLEDVGDASEEYQKRIRRLSYFIEQILKDIKGEIK